MLLVLVTGIIIASRVILASTRVIGKRVTLLMAILCMLQLLVFVKVCRMAKFVAGSLHLIPVLFFSVYLNTIYFKRARWQYCRIYGLDFPTSSVITGTRGAKARVSPPWRSPSCTRVFPSTGISLVELKPCHAISLLLIFVVDRVSKIQRAH